MQTKQKKIKAGGEGRVAVQNKETSSLIQFHLSPPHRTVWKKLIQVLNKHFLGWIGKQASQSQIYPRYKKNLEEVDKISFPHLIF